MIAIDGAGFCDDTRPGQLNNDPGFKDGDEIPSAVHQGCWSRTSAEEGWGIFFINNGASISSNQSVSRDHRLVMKADCVTLSDARRESCLAKAFLKVEWILCASTSAVTACQKLPANEKVRRLIEDLIQPVKNNITQRL